jgi:UDP-glucuronate 4-epimerase
MGQKILVTGCGGFIGFHTSKALLEAGWSVVGIDNMNDYYSVSLKEARLAQLTQNPHFSFHKIDISDRPQMAALWDQEPDIYHVIHLAAQAGVRYSLENPFAYTATNVVGHLVILELCRHRPGFQHLIYASSSSVYGNQPTLPLSVTQRTDAPVSLYAATKKMDELMSHSYAHLYKVPSTGLRFFTVYGPWGRPDMAAYIFTKAILEGRPIEVYNYGDMRRDFTHVQDIVTGILGILKTSLPHLHNPVPHKVYNLGNHRSEPLLKFIQTLEDSLGKKAEIQLLPLQAGDVKETYADITQSTQDFGFTPTTSIEEGIPSFVKWFKEYHGSR